MTTRMTTKMTPKMTTETMIQEKLSRPVIRGKTTRARATLDRHAGKVRFIVPFLWTLLALSGLAWSQTTLRTPSTTDPTKADGQCSLGECPGYERNSLDPRDSTADQQGDRPEPEPSQGKERDENQNGIEHRNADAARSRQPVLQTKDDAFDRPPTEFQKFVASSAGRVLPIYGLNLFDHAPSTFAPLDRIPVTGDYAIGPGDEILLRVWGQIELNAKLVVDRQGEIFLPKVGTLAVAGLQYQQLGNYLRSAIGRVFRNFDLTVSLGQLRSIQVFVLGQARRPGSYTVSSLCTLVNALFASGGPSGSGSMRRIQLKRSGHVVTEFDLYDLLLKGDTSHDTRLLPGDVIYIPAAGPFIALAGSVNVPAIFELREGTTLALAIQLAGGLSTTADGQKAMVERIDDHDVRRMEEFPLDVAGQSRNLQDGDVVRIFSLSPRIENAVTLRGNVAHPGRREWKPGMRLRDLLPDQDALVTRDYWRVANDKANADGRAAERGSTARSGDDEEFFPNGQARGEDKNKNDEMREAEFNRQTAPNDPVTGPGVHRHSITRNAPEINWDYAVIQRLNPQDLTTRLVPFDLGKLVLQRDAENNLALEPGDVVTIFSQSDLAVPLEKQSKFVRLEGEFHSAGVYRAEAGETVRHLVERVGGFTPNAYLYGAEFTRESTRVEQQKGLDQLIEKLEEDISRGAMAPSGVNPDEVADQNAKLEAQRQLVAKLRGIKSTGRVVLDLTPTSMTVADLPEIALEDGDRFVVPYRPATVEMLGAVYNKNSFIYRQDARVDDYLKRAGGPTRDADTSRMFVIRADGSVLSKQSVRGLWNGGFAALRMMPGDAIIVPERLSRGSFLKGLRDWSQVFSQFALGAAAIRVIQ